MKSLFLFLGIFSNFFLNQNIRIFYQRVQSILKTRLRYKWAIYICESTRGAASIVTQVAGEKHDTIWANKKFLLGLESGTLVPWRKDFTVTQWYLGWENKWIKEKRIIIGSGREEGRVCENNKISNESRDNGPDTSLHNFRNLIKSCGDFRR